MQLDDPIDAALGIHRSAFTGGYSGEGVTAKQQAEMDKINAEREITRRPTIVNDDSVKALKSQLSFNKTTAFVALGAVAVGASLLALAPAGSALLALGGLVSAFGAIGAVMYGSEILEDKSALKKQLATLSQNIEPTPEISAELPNLSKASSLNNMSKMRESFIQHNVENKTGLTMK
jgi:cell division protein FtsB